MQVFLPFALVQLGNAMVSMRRLNQFLVMEERSDEVEKLDTPGANIDDADFFWAEPPKPKVCVVSCMKFIAPKFSALSQLPPWEVPLCETCRSLRPSDDAHCQSRACCSPGSCPYHGAFNAGGIVLDLDSWNLQEDPKVVKKQQRRWRRKRGLKGSEGNEAEALPLTLVKTVKADAQVCASVSDPDPVCTACSANPWSVRC